ncbi:hypothetical protein GCM10020229_21220 [Kitasatospora albolonga]|uniref:hypothetical protein n=1 Tax=Kitasatospora albolonga TaxID=68173 RepID=UPI0031E551B3
MSTAMRRSIAAAATVVVAAGTGIVTNVATDSPSAGWWVALGVLVVLGGILQVYLTTSSGGPVPVTASGPGSIAIGGKATGALKTKVRGASTAASGPAPAPGGVSATGAGTIAVGEGAEGPVETDVT